MLAVALYDPLNKELTEERTNAGAAYESVQRDKGRPTDERKVLYTATHPVNHEDRASGLEYGKPISCKVIRHLVPSG
ncbi:MAG TPA: hypothetical protein VGE26_03840 [Sphingobacteriaceae bacterium]